MQRLSLPSRAVVTCTLPRTARGLADEQLEAVVPGAPGAADFHPDDADRLELSRGFDTANVDWVGPAEVHRHTAFGDLVISSDQHRWLALVPVLSLRQRTRASEHRLDKARQILARRSRHHAADSTQQGARLDASRRTARPRRPQASVS